MEGPSKNRKNICRDGPWNTEIQTDFLPNASQDHYCLSYPARMHIIEIEHPCLVVISPTAHAGNFVFYKLSGS
jgi:hypothetical protein